MGRAMTRPLEGAWPAEGHTTHFRRAVYFTPVLLVAVLLLAPVPTYASLEGGIITALAIDPEVPSTLYAGTHNRGVFKSTDAGETWRAMGPMETFVTGLAIHPVTPTTLYVTMHYRGVFKSTDGGESWTALGPATELFWQVAVDPVAATTVYAQSFAYDAVVKSPDAGATWDGLYVNLDLPGIIQSFAVHPRSPSTIYAARGFHPLDDWGIGGGVVKSEDGGATWSATGLMAVSVGAVTVDPRTPSIVFATFDQQPGAVKSVDGGATWNDVGLSGMFVGAFTIDASTPDTVYTGAGDRVLKSGDGGMTWTAVNVGSIDVVNALGRSPAVQCLAIDPVTPSTLYAGTDAGVFKSIDAGITWTPTGRF
jgi:photosystem II stability/assembly factor-like uncharacterized protein